MDVGTPVFLLRLSPRCPAPFCVLPMVDELMTVSEWKYLDQGSSEGQARLCMVRPPLAFACARRLLTNASPEQRLLVHQRRRQGRLQKA